MASRRDELLQDTEKMKEATAIRGNGAEDKKKWLSDIAKPKERHGWELERIPQTEQPG